MDLHRLMPDRRRLPNRRNAVTEALVIGNITIVATISFDAAGRPAEIFLSGAKDGSGLAAILDDASVVISVALRTRHPGGSSSKEHCPHPGNSRRTGNQAGL